MGHLLLKLVLHVLIQMVFLCVLNDFLVCFDITGIVESSSKIDRTLEEYFPNSETLPIIPYSLKTISLIFKPSMFPASIKNVRSLLLYGLIKTLDVIFLA